MTDGMCVICRRREPTRGRVCEPDWKTINDLLADLPRKMALLPLMLMPGQSPDGEKVATTRVGSPTPARLDALSLVGPGSVPVPGALHPLVRRWCTTREVTVQARVSATSVETHTTRIPEWHQELVIDQTTGEPVMVGDNDQVGVIPPAEWLDQQSRAWRAAFGHRRPPLAYVKGKPPKPPRSLVDWVMRNGTPEQLKAMFAVQAIRDQWARGAQALLAGNEPGYGGQRPTELREDDPVDDAWEIRFGERGITRDADTNVHYLVTWLEAACDRDDLDVARFAAELRSLSAELTRVLGEQPDHQWLGRCPAQITDKADDSTRSCGAGLWQDPHASVVECPRCHSAWGPRMVHLMHLAAEIRRVWPLDRRRRYNADEIDALKPIPCPGCTDTVRIDWQHVTGVGDKRRWWRPTRTRCPRGCEQGGEIL